MAAAFGGRAAANGVVIAVDFIEKRIIIIGLICRMGRLVRRGGHFDYLGVVT